MKFHCSRYQKFIVFHFVIISALLIELDVYSGVENPTWTVGSGDAAFSQLVSTLAVTTSTSLPILAGYRGFIVTVQMANGAAVVYKIGAGEQRSLELNLLNSNSGLDVNLAAVVNAAILGQVSFCDTVFFLFYPINLQGRRSTTDAMLCNKPISLCPIQLL